MSATMMHESMIAPPADADEVFLIPAGDRSDTPAAPETLYTPNGGPFAGARIRNVSIPSLTLFRPDRPNGTGMLIAPGGGFTHLSIEHEGYDVARWLNGLGVTALVLKYRLVPEAEIDGPDRSAHVAKARSAATEDAQLALNHVRGSAAELGIEPGSLGMMGFSAGGIITSATALGDQPPDFAAIIYGRADLPTSSTALPPLFIAQAHDDPACPPAAACEIYTHWQRAGADAELHIYSEGGHGFGVVTQNAPSDQWRATYEAWLRHRHLI